MDAGPQIMRNHGYRWTTYIERALMLGGIGGRRRRGRWQRIEMAGWHHWLNGCESDWTPGVGDGQGGLKCCNSWGCKESDTTERLNWTELSRIYCCYIIAGTEFKGKHILEQDELFCCVIISSGLKEKSLSFSSPWELQTPISSSRAPDLFLFFWDSGLLIHLPKNWLSQ